MSLQSFIGTVGNYGIARNNKFEVHLPRVLDSGVQMPSSDLIAMVYAESVDIPGKVVTTDLMRIQGKGWEMPTDFIYSDTLNMTFLVDTKMQLRNYFDYWLDLVVPNVVGTSFSPNMPTVYKHTLRVNLVDNIFDAKELRNLSSEKTNPVQAAVDAFKKSSTGKPSSTTAAKTQEKDVGKYTFINAYPKSVSGVQVSQGGRDFQRINVSFAFDIMECSFPQTNDKLAAPELTKGTGTGVLGSLNALGGRLGGTVGGVLGSVKNLPTKLNDFLGL